jgi:hypothetical protein
MTSSPARIGIVGTGMAAAACARELASAGLDVVLFEKSRGVGGRMATRRAEWAGTDGTPRRARFDHGAPGFSVQGAEFQRFVDSARRDGLLVPWQPRLAPRSHHPLEPTQLWLATPDMPALCRALLAGLPVHTGCNVDTLQRTAAGWSILCGGTRVSDGLAALLVTAPPPQAAALLQAVQPEWAERARALDMRPGWTLMGVSDDDIGSDMDSDPCATHAAWDLAWAPHPALAAVLRDDRKPGRDPQPGRACWVVHADAAWSRTHLEAEPAQVQALLQAALAEWLGRPLRWQHVAVHRWRYATAPRAAASPAPCWWDADAGLGVAGDALGGSGVEGAWRSGTELARRVLARFSPGGRS